MSMFWTIWISVITLGSIVGCFILLRWNLTNYTGHPEGESMGHEFDGIVEINNPLPRWWTILFYATIVELLLSGSVPRFRIFRRLLGLEKF